MARNRKRKSTNDGKTSQSTAEKKNRNDISIDSQEDENPKNMDDSNNKNTENEDNNLSSIPASGDKIPIQKNEIKEQRQPDESDQEKDLAFANLDEKERKCLPNDDELEEKKEKQIKDQITETQEPKSESEEKLPVPVSDEKAISSFQLHEEKVPEKNTGSEIILNENMKKTDTETMPPVTEVEKPPLLKCMELDQQAVNDVSDSQICNIDESTLMQENNNFQRSVEEHHLKENFGIECANGKVRNLLSHLTIMNRTILDAKKDMAAMRLKISQSLKSSKN